MEPILNESHKPVSPLTRLSLAVYTEWTYACKYQARYRSTGVVREPLLHGLPSTGGPSAGFTRVCKHVVTDASQGFSILLIQV